MSIFKIAKQFQQKLITASNQNLTNLQKINEACQAFGKTRDLWANAGEDPYGSDENVATAVDNISNIGQKAYSQAISQGMPASGNSGYAAVFNNLDAALEHLDSMGPFAKLDPSASNSLGNLKSVLQTAKSEFIPVAIPAKDSSVKLEEDTIYAKPPETGAGIGYEDEQEESPSALKSVVDSFTKSPEQPDYFSP